VTPPAADDVPDVDDEVWDSYPLGNVLITNLLTFIVVGVAYVGMQPMADGLVADVYLAVFIFDYLVLAPILRCRRCSYFGSRCSSGRGWLASKFFSPKTGDHGSGDMLAALHWTVWFQVFPAFALLYLVVDEFSDRRAAFMATFLLLQFAWSRARLQLSCLHCRERESCPISPYTEL
jgi:hypothetical protein